MLPTASWPRTYQSAGALRLPTLARACRSSLATSLLDGTSLIFPYAHLRHHALEPQHRARLGVHPPVRAALPAAALRRAAARRPARLRIALPWWVKLHRRRDQRRGLCGGAVGPAASQDPLRSRARHHARHGAADGRWRSRRPALVALAYVTLIVASGNLPTSDFQWALLRYWIGDLIGIAVVTPFLLIYAAAGKLPRLSLETALQAARHPPGAVRDLRRSWAARTCGCSTCCSCPSSGWACARGSRAPRFGLVLAQIGVIVGLLLTQEKTASVTSLQALHARPCARPAWRSAWW